MIRFKAVSYIDRACTGLEAFRFLIPADWSFTGGIRWSPDNAIMPAARGFLLSGGDIVVRELPGQAFFWTALPQVRRSHPVGSRYLGATVCPVLKAAEVIKSLVLPSLFEGADGIRIAEEAHVADIAGALGLGIGFERGIPASSEGARVRVEYRLDGRPYEEDVFCTVTSFTFAVPGNDIDYRFWFVDNQFTFRAEKGGLDANTGILQAIMHSFRLNPGWFQQYSRIVAYLKDRQMYPPYSLRQLSGDVEKIGISAGDELQSCESRQAVYQWIAGNLGRACSTGEYYDPIQQVCIRLPLGYDRAQASDRGEYLLSNAGDIPSDGGFAWKPMEPIGPPAGESPAASAGIV